MEFTNSKVAEALRAVAAAYMIKKGNLFQIRAYETAATAIEHLTLEVKDVWEEEKLEDLPGVGESIAAHLDELFKTGKVKHWEEVKKGIPDEVFDFLNIPGVGPKTALKLSKLGVDSLKDLEDKLKSGKLVEKGLSEKMAVKILQGLEEVTLRQAQSNRMLLPYAFAQAQRVLEYLRKSPDIKKADVLGSLRRMVATIGDLDFAVASDSPQEAVKYITSMPGDFRIAGKGETKVTLVMASGMELDFRIVSPETYGALLQYFTGSKSHNIHLRTLAEHKGLSLSEYGVKNVKTGRVEKTETEEEFYGLLGMETPPPETREDAGEIEASLDHKLPKLVTLQDIKGDLHIHDNFPIEPSHDLGVNSLKEIVEQAKKLNYEYVGISDHSPAVSGHTKEQIIDLIKKHTRYIEQYNYSVQYPRVQNLLEVDIQPDGKLSVPDEGLKLLDFALAGVHSSHNQSKEEMTNRIIKALQNPYVKVLTHPTGRLLNQRESYEADWETIFKYAAANKKAMEINAYPNRLDLPDHLVRMAKDLGVKFVIGTDAHVVDTMDNMLFGVAVARRGWLTKEDVVNTWEWEKFAKWFGLS